MHTSALGVRRSMISVLATWLGERLISASKYTPAPSPVTNAAAISALVYPLRPPPPSLPGPPPPPPRAPLPPAGALCGCCSVPGCCA
jgi:hypothetical protein